MSFKKVVKFLKEHVRLSEPEVSGESGDIVREPGLASPEAQRALDAIEHDHPESSLE